MKKIFKKVFKIENIPYLILALMMFWIFTKVTITSGDDEWFSAILDKSFNGSLVTYLKERYTGWTGRIVIESIMVPMFAYNIWIWRILNTIMTIILALGIYKLIPDKYTKQLTSSKKLLIKSIICISIFSLPDDVFSSAISWITGSYNYLWTMACGILSILPFKYALFNEKFDKRWYVLLVFTVILGCNMEQVSLVVLCFALITNIYVFIRDKKINVALVIFNTFILINTAILFLAPGNYERANKEIISWFGQWDMISLPVKLMMGTNLFLEHIFDKNIILLALLVILLNIAIWKKYKNMAIRLLAFIPMGTVIIKFIEIQLNSHNINTDFFMFKLLNIQNLNILNYNEIKIFLPTSILLCVILIIPVIFILVFDKIEMKYFSIILYLAAICSALSISISPTIYASGERVFFVTDILLIISSVLLLNEVLRKWKMNIYVILTFVFISYNSFSLYLKNILE